MASPLLGNAPLNALTFAGYGQGMRALEAALGPTTRSSAPGRPGGWLSSETTRAYLAGCWGGVLQCVVVTPVEYIKCQAQATRHSIGSLEIAKRLVRRHPVWPLGLYRGWWITVIRDVPSYGAYFWAYDASKLMLDRVRVQTFGGAPRASADAPFATPVVLLAGAIAGVICWTVTYPAERIKTEIQTASDHAPRADLRMAHVARRLWRQEGPAAFTRGLGTTVLRAVPVNAVTLYVYELVLRALAPAPSSR
jgi:solute carrier family 25 (mitochondrial carnitine/acylcarnitine transporter), member 20/29